MAEANESQAGNIIRAAELFQGGRRTRIKSLNGIEVDLMAAVHELPPNATIEGDVPDEVQLVVPHGGVTVRGFVGGNIIAEGNITVEGNVTGGWVISSRGNISVKGALANSRLIAKSGSIHAERLEGPACVFAWKDVTVAGEIRGGKVFGGTVSVGRSVTSAQVHSTGAIRAERFAVSTRGDTIICLRETLSCEDYGRPMADDERKLQRSIGKYLYKIDVANRLIRYATNEVNDSYKTYLYTMLCGNLNAQKIRTLRGLQCQANFLDELISTGEAFMSFFQRYALLGQDPPHDDVHTLANGCLDTIHMVSEDLQTMSTAFRLPHKGVIVGACGYLTTLAKKLDHDDLRVHAFKSQAQEMAESVGRWQTLLTELNEDITVHVRSFGLAPAVAQSVEAHPEKARPMLLKVIEQLKKEPGSPRFMRMKSPLVRLIQTSIDRNVKNIANWMRQLEGATQELNAVRDNLASNATTMFTTTTRGSTFVEAQAYESGVVLATNPIPKGDPLRTAVVTIRLSDAIESGAVFLLKDGQIERKLRHKTAPDAAKASAS